MTVPTDGTTVFTLSYRPSLGWCVWVGKDLRAFDFHTQSLAKDFGFSKGWVFLSLADWKGE
jgi:hypothetical protein